MLCQGECSICRKNTVVDKLENGYICEKCYIKFELMNAASFGIDMWKEQTIFYCEEYNKCIDNRIKEYITKIKQKYSDVIRQEQELLNKIKEDVKLRLSYYRKDELFLVFYGVREYIRRYLLVKQKPEWIYIGDISTISFMIKIMNDITKFENHRIDEIENGCYNLANAICWARRYVIIKDNISILDKKKHCINDIWYEAISNDNTENFFETYLKNGKFEKLEDYIIQNKVLKERLEKEKKTPKKILESIDGLLIEELGIKRESLNKLSEMCFKIEFSQEIDYKNWYMDKSNDKLLDRNFPIFLFEKKQIIDYVSEKEFEKILDVFSINRNNDKSEIFLELFCFYEVDDYIAFGNFDMAQSIYIFEKFLLSGHFLDVFKQGISSKKMFAKAQRNISNYFSYCVADLLFSNGYELPLEKYYSNDCIRVEIEKIDINGKNILVKLGDIDVLALNRKRKEILLFELKYYKPAVEYKDMFIRDKSIIIDKEVIRHIKDRESAIEKNIDAVVKFITGKEENGYLVNSILLSPRTNYYGLCQEEVKYLTWDKLCESAKELSL